MALLCSRVPRGQVFPALPSLWGMLVTQDTDCLAWHLALWAGRQVDGLTDRPESVLEEKSTCWGFLHILLVLTFSQQVALLGHCCYEELCNEKITD